MTVVYAASRLWSGDTGSAIANGAVAVSGGTVGWAGPIADLPAEFTDAEVRSFAGATIMPGLIESHAHLSYDGAPGTKKRSLGRSGPALVAVMLHSARQLLNVGVTTVRDLGSRDSLSLEAREIVREGLAIGPRILAAGAQLTTTGGHTWQNHGAADSPDEIRALVRRHHRAGVDLFKVNATGGFMTAGSAPWSAQFSVEELSVIVEEAHRLGKRVAAHAHGVEGIQRAVVSGVDTIEHCTFVAREGVIEPDLALIDEIAARGIFVCPTVTWNLPAMMRANPAFTPPVRLLHERGVKLIAGTDAGIDGVPHAAYVGGLEAFATFGLSPEEVLVAATSRAAEALGVSSTTGRLAVGLAADLIVVNGDPLRDVSELRSLELVVARGEEHTPESVDVPPRDPALAEVRVPDSNEEDDS